MADERIPIGLARRHPSRGELSRFILDTLRGAPEPLTSLELTLEFLVCRALDHRDRKLLRLTTGRIRLALRYQRAKGHVRSRQGPGPWLLGEIVRLITD